MEEFEKLLEAERITVERFVRFRLNSKTDADDVLQEVFLAAYGAVRFAGARMLAKSKLLAVLGVVLFVSHNILLVLGTGWEWNPRF